MVTFKRLNAIHWVVKLGSGRCWLRARGCASRFWSSFDTRHAYYVTGTTASVRWRNPHNEVVLRLEGVELTVDCVNRKLPAARMVVGERWTRHRGICAPPTTEANSCKLDLNVRRP